MAPYLSFQISSQPDVSTCGPTCLQSIYQYYGDSIDLETVVAETPKLEEGGTLAVFLACHALRRGYKARVYTYNLEVFDLTWFIQPNVDLAERLRSQLEYKSKPKLRLATQGYLDFLALGGEICFEDLRPGLIRHYLKRGIPVLTGLSATYLYREPREFGPEGDADDLRGESVGHFVVLHGYDKQRRRVYVADPLHTNPLSDSQYYAVDIDRAIGAILLGVLTYDANFLIIQSPPSRKGRDHAGSGRR